MYENRVFSKTIEVFEKCLSLFTESISVFRLVGKGALALGQFQLARSFHII